MFDVLYSFILMYEFDGAFQLEASFLVDYMGCELCSHVILE